MRNVLGFLGFLNERKNYGTLYHFTTLRGLKGILEDDELTSSFEVSLTRNPDFKEWYTEHDSVVRIAIDGETFTDKVKVVPTLYNPSDDPIMGGDELLSPKARREMFGNEREERVHSQSVKGIKKHILSVEMIVPNRVVGSERAFDGIAKKYSDLDFRKVEKFLSYSLERFKKAS